MKQMKIPQFHDQAESVRQQFVQALPVIGFFLLMFYSVIFLFGMEYTMVVSLGTLIFQVNYKKKNTYEQVLLLIPHNLFLLILAYIATWNLPLCLVLNLVVPFWLIFSKSSQFNQLGYFSSLMTFAFLQLMPVDLHGFMIQLEAMTVCIVAGILAILFYMILDRKPHGIGTEQKVMDLMGRIMKKFLEGEEFRDDLTELFRYQRGLYQEAYQQRGKKHVVNSKGKLKYMFAMLTQRTVYLISNQSRLITPANDEEKDYAYMLADYMIETGNTDFLSGERTDEIRNLKKKGRRLLRQAEQGKDEFYKSMTSFFWLFLFILYQAEQKDDSRMLQDEHWEIPAGQRLKERVLSHFRPDTFEMRFALRMSVVLMVGMAVNMLFDEGHSYWFVMNAFLLLRPMYEDSNYRMRTRFIGTAAGCVLVVLILPFSTGFASHLIIAGIMVACMYTATPGTTVHAVFVTCFALTMTTMAMGESSAVFLRMAYVLAAVLFVLVINRFFFPTSMGSQFRYNFQMIFHMHHMYLRILENALTEPLDYWRLCDAQIQYHMVYAQIRQDLPKLEKDQARQEYYYNILSIAWRMASEVQQMLFLVKHKKGGAEERRIMEQYIYYSDHVLNQIQEMLHLKKEKRIKNIVGMKYQRYIEGRLELSALMTQYARNLSRLYVIVLRRYRQP